MAKQFIVLEFSIFPFMNYNSEQEQMIRWCKNRGMEVQNLIERLGYRVKFLRDKNTLDFIKEFLEPKVHHALPFDSLKTIPGVKIVEYQE